jgi:ABC-type uncharacterized transport system permease subunit
LALAITAALGAIMFAMLGKAPHLALYSYFIEPLTESVVDP